VKRRELFGSKKTREIGTFCTESVRNHPGAERDLSLNLFDDLHHRHVPIFSEQAFCSQFVGHFLEPLRLKSGAALLSVIVTAEPDIDVPRVRHGTIVIR
jgi:hypothetical protein